MHEDRQQKCKTGMLVAGMALSLALGCLFQFSVLGERFDESLIDTHTRLLRHFFPRPLARDVVVVGVDEASAQFFKEPRSLWHRHLGDFLKGVSQGGATVVGLDWVLPDRSYNDILAGGDEALMTGILAARKKMPVVLAITVDSQGKVRPILRKYELVAGEGGTGLALFPPDHDKAVRRFDESLNDNGPPVPTLVGQMVRKLGGVPGRGIIDYSVGEAFRPVPLHQVVEWVRAGDQARLLATFSGRPVLLGSVMPAEDRMLQPVNLLMGEDEGHLSPGVLAHAQTLRSVLGSGLVKPLPVWLGLVLMALTAGWFAAGLPARRALAAFLLGSVLLFVVSLGLFRLGSFLPLSGLFFCTFVALAGRAGFDAAFLLKERHLLRRSFAGAVSPVVMAEILAGKFSPEPGGERKHVCILFADIRGFTTMSEAMPPEDVITLLNRYYERVVAVIHQADGAVLSFMGDGIMAIFGAPKTLQAPQSAAFGAAKAMLSEVDRLNEELVAEGRLPIRIGVGLHAGEAVVGNVGSSGRHDYTAIGDVSNVASRLEGLTKEVGYAVVCSKEIAESLEIEDKPEYLGARMIKGHTPVEVYGWGSLKQEAVC